MPSPSAPRRGPSLWLDYDYAPRDPLSADLEVDVVVIGGGLAGISSALHCAKAGLSVAVLEGDAIGFGATGRNAGFILAGVAERHSRVAALFGEQRARDLWSLTLRNHRLMADAINEFKIDCDYEQRGSIQLSSSGQEDDELQASASLLEKDGFPGRYLPPGALPEVYQGAGFGGALEIPSDGALDPARFVRGLASACEGLGVQIFEGSIVVDVDAQTLGDVRVRTEGGSIKAMAALLCTNALAGDLAPVLKAQVDPNRGQMLATAPIPPLFDRPVYANHGFEYWRQLPNGQIVIGGWRYLDVEGERGLDDQVHPNIQGAMEAFLHRFPALKGIPITHRWSGVMGFSRDGLPLVGPVPGTPGMLSAVGFTGHGFGFAFLAGRALAQLLEGGTSEVDGLLAPRRLVNA